MRITRSTGFPWLGRIVLDASAVDATVELKVATRLHKLQVLFVQQSMQLLAVSTLHAALA